jgi:dihydroorotase
VRASQQKPLLIRGGHLVDPRAGIDRKMEILLEDGVVAAVDEKIDGRKSRDAEVFDAEGAVVAPGFIDLHVHLREPGFEYKETIATGCAAAAAGGFTAVCAMANTDPVNDERAVTEFIRRRAEEAGLARVHPVGAVSHGLKGKALAEMGEMWAAGAVAFSDDGKPIVDGMLMRRALEYTKLLGAPVVSHAECPDISAGGCMNEGAVSSRFGLPGVPNASEEAMVARDILLARLTGGRLHVAHLSTKGALAMVRDAKREGLRVTCEVTPHHLALSDRAFLDRPFSTDLKMNPPLRAPEDVEALVAGLADGTVDAIATDHAPHAADEKALELENAPNGVIGLETAVPILLDRFVHRGVFGMRRLVELFSSGPAAAFGLPGGTLAAGSPADVTVLNPGKSLTVKRADLLSKSKNTPFDGWKLRGRAIATIVGGRVVWSLAPVRAE